jgi:diaminopimelate epimerase
MNRLMNGAGNTFVMVDLRHGQTPPTPEEVRRLARPERGRPSDQVIGVLPATADSDIGMVIWNADGSTSGACGNAARCVAWLAFEAGAGEHIRLASPSGMLEAWRVGPQAVCVDMGRPRLEWELIPLAERMDTRRIDVRLGPIDAPFLIGPAAVSMGNPHVTFFVEDLARIDVAKAGSLLEWHPLFPEGMNVGFAQVVGTDHLRLRVWERGAGLTLACGTGACAAAVNAHRRGLTGRTVRVSVDGGELSIHWRADDHVLMTGPVELEG